MAADAHTIRHNSPVFAETRPLHLNVSRRNCCMIKTDGKRTRLNSSHRCISYAVFCLKKTLTSAQTNLAPAPPAPADSATKPLTSDAISPKPNNFDSLLTSFFLNGEPAISSHSMSRNTPDGI